MAAAASALALDLGERPGVESPQTGFGDVGREEEGSLAALHMNIDPFKNIHGRALLELYCDDAEGRYRTLFETGTGGGSLDLDRRRGWERRIFGDAYDGHDAARPKCATRAIQPTDGQPTDSQPTDIWSWPRGHKSLARRRRGRALTVGWWWQVRQRQLPGAREGRPRRGALRQLLPAAAAGGAGALHIASAGRQLGVS